MHRPGPAIVGLLAVVFSVAACSNDDRAASPIPATRSTTAAPTNTTTPNITTLDIDGSPMIEFSVAVDEVALEGQLFGGDLVSLVIETLSDDRSWIGHGAGFWPVEDGGLFTITVATPERTDELCWPLRTKGRLSCARNG